MSKTGFGVIFIVCATIFFLLMFQFGWFEDYIHVLLIPSLMTAYYFGQISERKFGDSKDEDLKK